jgi:hypothetical protein
LSQELKFLVVLAVWFSLGGLLHFSVVGVMWRFLVVVGKDFKGNAI